MEMQHNQGVNADAPHTTERAKGGQTPMISTKGEYLVVRNGQQSGRQ